MNIIVQIYWITVLAGVLSAILRIKLNRGIDPFKAMRDIQKDIDSMSEKWANRITNLINWMTDNTPFSIYMVVGTLSIIPIINLIYFYANVKGAITDSKE